MATDIEWINGILDDLLSPEHKLSDTILKVKLLATRLKSEKLKNWVENEITGYVGKDVPDYRIIKVGIFGNMYQNRGYEGFLTRKAEPIPLEQLPQNLKDLITECHLKVPISELEDMSQSKEDFRTDIPHSLYPTLSQGLGNDWQVDSAWQLITVSRTQGILNKIKSHLIDFLTEISAEIGENENINFLKSKPKVDNIFDRTFGPISGQTVNISLGKESIQQINVGKHSTSNVASGKHINQSINQEITGEVKAIMKQLSEKLDQIPLNTDEKEDIIIESQRINNQLIRENPKVDIIQNSLRVIEGILLGVAANALTPPILDAITVLLSKIP